MNEKKDAGKAKGAVIERVAELAMKLSRPHLADYGSTRSRHDFTQRQLMACLILRAYLGTTYRGVLDVLAASDALRQRLGLTDKLPHYTTLQKFSARSQVLAIVQKLLASLGGQLPVEKAAAMDATGLSRMTASDYFCSRKGRQFRRWVKLSVVVLCSSLIPLALAVNLTPAHDRKSAKALLTQAQKVTKPARLYADAGYDAEWIHKQCREQWGVESVINPVQRRADGKRGGKWRAKMSPKYLKRADYGQRWKVESFFSGFKRTMGSSLRARRDHQLIAETAIRVLAYALRR